MISLFLGPVFAFNIAFCGSSKTVAKITHADVTPTQNISVEDSTPKKLYNVLLMGEDETSGLSDVLIIVSCDTICKTVHVLQIPRDTYAEYTSAAYRKINGARDVLGSGREVADFLEENLCIPIDHFITLELDTLGKIVDALGGVEVDVPFDMSYNDPYQNLEIDIKKGRQTLDGELAKQFVRYRSGYKRGDLDRLDTQKLFLSALFEKISKERNILSLIEILITFLPQTETDISYEYCFELVKSFGIPEMKNISFVTLPGGDIRGSSGAWYYVMNRKSAYDIIKELFVTNLTEAEFDSERKFTSDVRKGFNEIYEASNGYEVKLYTAEEMNGGENN